MHFHPNCRRVPRVCEGVFSVVVAAAASVYVAGIAVVVVVVVLVTLSVDVVVLVLVIFVLLCCFWCCVSFCVHLFWVALLQFEFV